MRIYPDEDPATRPRRPANVLAKMFLATGFEVEFFDCNGNRGGYHDIVSFEAHGHWADEPEGLMRNISCWDPMHRFIKLGIHVYPERGSDKRSWAVPGGDQLK